MAVVDAKQKSTLSFYFYSLLVEFIFVYAFVVLIDNQKVNKSFKQCIYSQTDMKEKRNMVLGQR